MKTPQDIEVVWEKSTTQALEFCERLPKITLILAVFLFWFWNTVLFHAEWTASYPVWANFDYFAQRKDLGYPLTLGAGMILFMPSSWRLPMMVFTAIAAWFWGFSKISPMFHPELFSLVIFLAGAAVILQIKNMGFRSFRLSRRQTIISKCLLFTSWFLAYCWYLGDFSSRSGDTLLMAQFWLHHPEFFLISALSWIIFRKSSGAGLMPFLITNSIFFNLWPVELKFETVDQHKLRRLVWQGFGNLTFAYLLIFLDVHLVRFAQHAEPQLTAWAQALGIHILWLYVPFFYLNFSLQLSAGFNFGVGFIRSWGFDVPDMINFPGLAQTPLEVWRRASVYAYQFVLNYIFIPSYRVTRSLFLAGGACASFVIFHLYIFHELVINSFYKYFFPKLGASPPKLSLLSVQLFVFALLWLLLTLISIPWGKALQQKPSAVKSWISVFITQVILMLFVPIAFYIITPIVTKGLGIK